VVSQGGAQLSAASGVLGKNQKRDRSREKTYALTCSIRSTRQSCCLNGTFTLPMHNPGGLTPFPQLVRKIVPSRYLLPSAIESDKVGDGHGQQLNWMKYNPGERTNCGRESPLLYR